jgi:hypothetical protein
MRGGLVADQRDGDGRLGLTETAGTWPGTLGLMTTMLPFHIGVVGGDVLGDREQVVTPFSQPLVGLSIPTFHYLREGRPRAPLTVAGGLLLGRQKEGGGREILKTSSQHAA